MIARLALVIAQYQCDEMYRGRDNAVSDLLPLKNDNWTDDDKSSEKGDGNWITRGNALRLNWMKVCPHDGLKAVVDDDGKLAFNRSKQAAVKFQSEGNEVYICGNPPYVSSRGGRTAEQNDDMRKVFHGHGVNFGHIDYVTAWFVLAAEYMQSVKSPVRTASAFVSTNSICQGTHVPLFWPAVFGLGCRIVFAHTSFKWKNHASDNAGVSVVVVGLSNKKGGSRLFFTDSQGDAFQDVKGISPYLFPGGNVVVDIAPEPLCGQSVMCEGSRQGDGSLRGDGSGLVVSKGELDAMSLSPEQHKKFVRPCIGGKDFIDGRKRFCLWIKDGCVDEARNIPAIRKRIDGVRDFRLKSSSRQMLIAAETPHKFQLVVNQGERNTIIVPKISSEKRYYLPVGLLPADVVVVNSALCLFDAPLWNLSLLLSRLHVVWISTICGRLESRLLYNSTLGWNAFPIPKLTTQNKRDMKRCAEEILVERKRCLGKSVANLYDRDKMPENLRAAHARNDEVIASIYIGRKEFRDDAEMREHLFSRYADMKKDINLAAKQKHATKSNKNLKSGLFANKKKGSA